MLARTYYLFLVVAIKAVHGDRNIIASTALCATYPNEEFAINVKRCQNTCEEYGRTWDCPGYKPYGDCYCKKGFARITEDGKCVSVTKNATCAQKLPITVVSCGGDNEYYKEQIVMGNCEDGTCLTYECSILNPYLGTNVKWGPHCECADSYLRLKNGTCVRENDLSCVAEYQPSAERCAAIGQKFTKNGPCQAGCNGENYCPPKGQPACICPTDTIPHVIQSWRYPPELYAGTTTTLAPGDRTYTQMIQDNLLGCYMECQPANTGPAPTTAAPAKR